MRLSVVQDLSEILIALFSYFSDQISDPDHFCEDCLKQENQLAEMYFFLKELVGEHLPKLNTMLFASKKHWRLHEQFYGELVKVIEYMPFCFQADFTTIFTDKLLRILRGAIEPTKQKAALLLANCLHFVYSNHAKRELMATLLAEFGSSNRSSFRKIFIDFCIYLMPLKSQKFFFANFLKPLQRMAADKVPNIRIKYLRDAVPALNSRFGVNNPQMALELVNTVNGLKVDRDSDVGDTAMDVDEAVRFHLQPSSDLIKTAEDFEKNLQKFEARLESRDKWEQDEEEKRRKEEEEEKFDFAALLARHNKSKGKHGLGKRHSSMARSIETDKRSLQHRHLLSSQDSKKLMPSAKIKKAAAEFGVKRGSVTPNSTETTTFSDKVGKFESKLSTFNTITSRKASNQYSK